jgi:hypothetical protein
MLQCPPTSRSWTPRSTQCIRSGQLTAIHDFSHNATILTSVLDCIQIYPSCTDAEAI